MDEKNQEPVINIYGVTKEGDSVLCRVHGFLPYAYFLVSPGITEFHLGRFKRYISDCLGEDRSVITKCEIVRRCNLYGYNEEETFVKVTLTNPYKLSKLGDAVKNFQIFESNLDFTLRFMIDTKIVGMSWIELPAGFYQGNSRDSTRNHHEVDVCYEKIISHPPEGHMATIAPLRILSFDIECTGLESKTNEVIQIANVVSVHGEKEPCAKVIFTLDGCSAIEGAKVRSFRTEGELLMAWRDFIIEADPDIFTGYNINGFDFPFLIDRASLLGLNGFPYFGRNDKTRCRVIVKETTTKALGTRVTKVIYIPGRTLFDICEVIRRNYGLRQYTLKFVCQHFLEGEEKIDLPYEEIPLLQKGSNDDRRRIAEYCLKDAELPLLLMDKLMCLINHIELARVTGVPLSYLLTRGQQIKVLSQLYRKATFEWYVIPVIKSDLGVDDDDGYVGATVIEPNTGFYDIPIATLDFASLYPSIMQAHNLCYSTYLSPNMIEERQLVRGRDYLVTPNGDAFLSISTRKGLLPRILEDLIAARKRAKDELKKETDPFKRAVLDGRQLALKISANSVYGFTGALRGYLPCQAIAASVTAFGRKMIKKTRRLIWARYTVSNGYEHDAKVLYGDTDSVMVKFGYSDLAKVMKLGEEAAEYVSSYFEHPIKLEFEKVYFPYLLIGKKRYVGLKYTDPCGSGRLDVKGIDIVRRDRCGLIQEVMQSCLDAIMVNRDVDEAVSIVHQAIGELLQCNVNIKLLTFTGGWCKSEYDRDPPHVAVAKKMMLRDLNVIFGPGDRITYVIAAGVKGSPVSVRAEDPGFVQANNIPIDVVYYLEAMKRSLVVIFSPIYGGNNKEEGDKKAKKILFTGEHMNRVVKKIPDLTRTAFAGFTVTKRCKSCKNPLKDNACSTCNILII
jgi:DNA polymerase delta subunit 1